MAARKRRVKASPREVEINRTAKIMQRLERHALGELDAKYRDSRSPMTDSQIQAAKIVLAKRLPDLQRTELSGDPAAPLRAELTLSLPKAALAAITKAFDEKF